jgi:hypothetical protein
MSVYSLLKEYERDDEQCLLSPAYVKKICVLIAAARRNQVQGEPDVELTEALRELDR